jgi:hypothetical protein
MFLRFKENEMETDQIKATAEKVLLPRLGERGLERIEVEPGYDHDNDPVLFVKAFYKEGSDVPSGDVMLDALSALHDALLEAGESRIPFLEHRFPGEEPIYDEDDEDYESSGGPKP